MAALLIWTTLGCAAMTKTGTRTDRDVLDTKPAVVTRDGDVRAEGVAWDGDVLTATLVRPRVCLDVARSTVSLQSVREHETRGVALSIVGGLALAAGGGAWLVAAQGMSTAPGPIDAETGKAGASDRDLHTFAGGMFAVSGAIWTVHGLYIAGKGADENLGDPREITEDKPTRPERECGLTELPPGELRIELGGQGFDRRPLAEPGIELDLRRDAPEACSQEALLGKPLRVVFVSRDDRRTVLSSHDADACIRRQLVLKAFNGAAEQLGRADGPAAVAAVASELERASGLIAALPAGDRDAPSLTKELARLRASTEAASSRLLDRALKAFEQAHRARELASAETTARTVFSLARAVPSKQAQSYRRMFAALGSAAAGLASEDLQLVRQLAAFDSLVRPCLLQDPSICPDWLPRAELDAALRPLVERLTGETQQAAAAVGKTRGAFDKKVAERSFAALSSAVEDAERTEAWCKSPQWDRAVAGACGRLTGELGAARNSLERESQALASIRAARTSKAWRALFPQCRKVAGTIEAMRALSSCDAGCKQILGRVAADHQKLREFSIEDAVYQPATIEALRSDCATARCPTCP